MLCPIDCKPCCDDLCRGSSRCLQTGDSMLQRCPGGCGALVDVNGPDRSECECDPVDYEDDGRDDDGRYD